MRSVMSCPVETKWVMFRSDPAAFVFPDGFQMSGQGAQLLLGVAELLLHPNALGDVVPGRNKMGDVQIGPGRVRLPGRIPDERPGRATAPGSCGAAPPSECAR